MIRLLLFALLFAMPAAADDVFMNNTTSESNMCVIDVTGQAQSTPSVVAHANWSPITYTCPAGTYLPADGVECVACPGGKYCEGGEYSYNETTPQGITGDITAGYYSSGGASTATGSTCLSGYSCGNCASSNGANGRPQYSAAGASSCSECPAVTGELASRATGAYSYYPRIHNVGINGCYAWFYDTDDTASMSILCYYSSLDGAYGGQDSTCQTDGPFSCIAGYGSIIQSSDIWADWGNATGKGVDFANGKACGPCPAGTYSAAGDTTCTPCATNYTSSAGASVCVPMTYNINYVLNGGSSVPSTYTQLEYLESTGTQWIDTGLTVKQNSRAEFEYQFVGNDWNFVFGQVGAPGTNVCSHCLGYRSDRIWWFTNSDFDFRDNEKHKVVFASDGNAYKDNVVIATRGEYVAYQDQTMLMFAERNDAEGGYIIHKGKVKIYDLKFYEGDSIVRNFIPARRNSDNVLGMYDTVSGTFFTNDGTGTFVAGPDAGSNWSQYTYGTGATVNATPTRSHSSFVGWCTDAGLTNCATTQTIGTNATGDKTFYAKYLCDTGYSTNVSNTACSANTITVNWDNGAGGATQNTCTYGGDLTTPTTAPTKRGHVFTGWTFDVN